MSAVTSPTTPAGPGGTNRLTLAGIVRRHAAERPDAVAMRFAGGSMTYGELDRRSSQVAQALRASGVRAGDRVAMLDKNSPEQFELVFGAAKIDAIPTPVSFRLSAPEVTTVFADSTPSAFVVGAELADVGEAVAATLDGVPVFGIGDDDRFESYERWRDGHAPDDPGVEQDPDSTAFLLYSSGTTGLPKGIQISHANMASSFTIYRQLMGLDERASVLVALPLFHVGGLGWALVGFIEGATQVIVREIVPGPLADLLAAERITHAGLVPAVLQFLLQLPDLDARDFSALRAILYGASPISEPVLRGSLEAFGCEFFQAYGLSETTGTTLVLPPADHDPDGPNAGRLRSAGKVLPGHELKVVDPSTGDEVPTGEVGEVLFKGPNVTPGYWGKPELTAETIVDGWLHTGDAGYLDADGYLYLYDRIKDMIVSGGENIYAAEIERALQSHPAVADVAVIAVPSERWGETPKALVVRAPGAEVTEQELLDHCRAQLASFKCPSSVEWLDELPRNATGKVLKKELRAPYWQGHERRVG